MGLPRRPPPTKAPATPTHGASLAVPDETNLDAFVPVEALDGALTLEVAVAAVDPTQPETGPSLARARFDAPLDDCLLYTSPSPRDKRQSRMPSSA